MARGVRVPQDRFGDCDGLDLGLAGGRWAHGERGQGVCRQPESIRSREEAGDGLHRDDFRPTLGEELTEGVVEQEVRTERRLLTGFGVDEPAVMVSRSTASAR